MKAVKTIDHHTKLVAAPRLIGHTAVDVLEAKRYPTALVVCPEQSRHRRLGRQRRHYDRLASMHARRIGIRLLADGLDETPAAIAGADSRRQPGRKTTGLSHRFHNGAADALFDRSLH